MESSRAPPDRRALLDRKANRAQRVNRAYRACKDRREFRAYKGPKAPLVRRVSEVLPVLRGPLVRVHIPPPARRGTLVRRLPLTRH